MNTNLILPTKVKSITPKPTKTQLVEALLAQALRNHAEAEDLKSQKRDEIEDNIKKHAIAVLLKKKNPLQDANAIFQNHNECKMSLSIVIKDSQSITMLKKLKTLQPSRIYAPDIKAKILEQLKSPNVLLGDDYNQMLKAMLDQIFIPTKTIEI